MPDITKQLKVAKIAVRKWTMRKALAGDLDKECEMMSRLLNKTLGTLALRLKNALKKKDKVLIESRRTAFIESCNRRLQKPKSAKAQQGGCDNDKTQDDDSECGSECSELSLRD